MMTARPLILQRRRQNLAGAGTVAIDENHNRILLGGQHQRTFLVGVLDFLFLIPAPRADDPPLFEEQIGDLDRRPATGRRDCCAGR